MSATRERLQAAHDDLVAAVETLTTGERWQAMLAVAARFTRYSPNNVLLILLQRPDATRVAGYRAWQALGRQVRKGERGVRILAPCRYTVKGTDDDGAETARTVLRGFTTATVFDVSQTDGAALPDVRPELLRGASPRGLWDALAAQVAAAGYRLERGDCGRANGTTSHTDRTVRIRDDVDEAQAAKTLAHEIAHVLMHPSALEYAGCRGRCEVEAESVAYLVCQAAGLATDGYTWPYVASWSQGDPGVVRDTAGRVIETAHAIVAAMEPGELEAAA